MNKVFVTALLLSLLGGGVAYANPGAGPPTVGSTSAPAPTSASSNGGAATGVDSTVGLSCANGYTGSNEARSCARFDGFSEVEARARIAAFGYLNVTGLQQDDRSIWRGQATINGVAVNIALNAEGGVVTE